MNHPEISWDVTRDFPMKDLQAMALGSSRGSETAPWRQTKVEFHLMSHGGGYIKRAYMVFFFMFGFE